MIVSALIPAAGLGIRLKSSLPKPLVRIGAKPVLIHTLHALARCKCITQAIVAVGRDNFDAYEALLKRYRLRKRVSLVLGGATRRDSVEHCLKKAAGECDTVLIHDAARPFLSQELLEAVLEEAKKSPAVICGVPVKATIKQVSGGRSVFVEKTLNRENVWEIQTPQVFRKSVLLEAYARYKNAAVTDDAALVEKLGVRIKVVRGSYFNIKITTPEDLVFAEAIAKSLINE